MLRMTLWALLMLLICLGSNARSSDRFCTSKSEQAAEEKLIRRQTLASQLARNNADLVIELETLERRTRRLAWSASTLYAISVSTLITAASAEIAIIAGARAATSIVASSIAKGAQWMASPPFNWHKTLGMLWEYSRGTAVTVAMRDNYAERALKPILKKIDKIGTGDFLPDNETGLSYMLAQEYHRLAEFQKEAAPHLHEGRWFTLGWDDVHNLELMLVTARARQRLYDAEQRGTERLIWNVRAACQGAPYGDVLKLAHNAKKALDDLQSGRANIAAIHVTGVLDKRFEWRAAPRLSSSSTRTSAAR